MQKKILTLDDLAKFCAENKMQKFSSSESGYKLCVQIPSTYESDEESSTDSILYGKVKLLHTGRNRNGSNVTKKAAEKCMSGIQYKPLLANFCEIDGVMDFTSHDMEINEDGSINYLEHQIGCFTSDKPSLEYDSEKDRYYIYANVAIPREYTAASEIIERKNGTKISAELYINEMSYDAKERELVLDDIEVMGATCLGVHPESGKEVQEGMEGARLDIADFSVENNSVKFSQNDKLIELLEELNTTISNLNIDALKEGGKTMENSNEVFDEVTEEQVDETVDEVTEESTEEEVTTTEDDSEESTEESSDTDEADTADVELESVDEEETESVKFTVSHGDTVKEFSLSLNDKLSAMYCLINDTYGESDNDFYDINMYDDEKYVEMYGWFSGKSYRQQYKVKKDTYSLVGDRVQVYAKYLTEDEINALESMKSNYSVIEDKLSKYESEPQKVEILESNDYGYIADTEEFMSLKEQTNHFDMSVEEVKAKADEILLQYAKKGAFKFEKSENESPMNVGVKPLPSIPKKTGRYGNLFSK